MASHLVIFFTLVVLTAIAAASGGNEKLFRLDYEYNSDVDGWFKLHNIPATWEDARHRCYYEGAVLASPQYNRTAYILKSMLQYMPIYSGLRATSPGDYFSVEGVDMMDMPFAWAKGQPDKKENKERCLVFINEGEMADVECNRIFPYLCFKERTVDLVETECGTVDTKYKLDKRTGKCYKFHRAGMTWTRAMTACSAEGGHLAIINSNVEAEVINDVFAQNPASTISALFKDGARLGFYEWDKTGPWGTIHGQTLEEAGYAKWRDGEPNDIVLNGNKEHCGSVFRWGSLENSFCDINMAFICEKDPKTSTVRFS